MTPPPPPPPSTEKTTEAAAPEGLQSYRGLLPTPFLTKTYQIVDDPALDNIISWNEDGSTFIVWRPVELAGELLPKFFKHNNFSSFVRQLNTYGFRKIVPDRWEFGNEFFRRGERHLLSGIHRRKVTAAVSPATATAATVIPVAAPTHSAEEQVLSSNSSPGVAVPPAPPRHFLPGNLIEENERLRKENSMLTEELGQMKGLCDSIMILMSKYSASQQAGEVTSPVSVATALELMASAPDVAEGPAKEVAQAMLFGVAIGTKRAREEAGDERAVSVKSEAESGESVEAQSWVL